MQSLKSDFDIYNRDKAILEQILADDPQRLSQTVLKLNLSHTLIFKSLYGKLYLVLRSHGLDGTYYDPIKRVSKDEAQMWALEYPSLDILQISL
ncbi:MAG: hypothetical protein ACPGVT_11015 [Maricaulaceae bacterium]